MMNRLPHSRPAYQYKGVELHRPGNRGEQHHGQRALPGPGERSGRDNRFGAAIEQFGHDRVGPISETRNGSRTQKNRPLNTMPSQQMMSAARGGCRAFRGLGRFGLGDAHE